MTRSSTLAAAALGATLSIGAIGLGAALLPSVAGAQDADPAAASAAPSEVAAARAETGARHRGHPRLRELAKAELRIAADTVGIPVEDLREAVRGGQSISEVAEANGVSPQVVVDAVVADLVSRLDRAVADGRITRERADAVEERLPERVTNLVNRHRVVRPG